MADNSSECPVCQKKLDSLSSDDKQSHVNKCLDADATKLDELFAKSLIENESGRNRYLTSDIFSCPLCKRSLSHYSVGQRGIHVNRCSDEFEKIYGKPERKKKKLAVGKVKKKIKNGLTCKYCEKIFPKEKFIAHMKRCSKKHNIPVLQLLQDIQKIPFKRDNTPTQNQCIKSNSADNLTRCTEKTAIVKQRCHSDEIFKKILGPLYPDDQLESCDMKQEVKKSVKIPSAIAERGYGESFKVSKEQRLWNLHMFDKNTNVDNFIVPGLHEAIKVNDQHHEKEKSFTETQQEKLDILMDLNKTHYATQNGENGFIQESSSQSISNECHEKVCSDMLKLLDVSKYTPDIVIQCDNNIKVNAHRIVLLCRAEKILNFETRSNHLDMSTFSESTIKALLHYIYGGVLPKDVAIIWQLYELAEQLDLELLIKLCEDQYPRDYLEKPYSNEESENPVEKFWKTTQECFQDDSPLLHDNNELNPYHVLVVDDDETNDDALSDTEINMMREIFQTQQVHGMTVQHKAECTDTESDCTEYTEDNTTDAIDFKRDKNSNEIFSKRLLQNDDFISEYVCGSPDVISDTENDHLVINHESKPSKTSNYGDNASNYGGNISNGGGIISNDGDILGEKPVSKVFNHKITDISPIHDSELFNQLEDFNNSYLDEEMPASPPIFSQNVVDQERFGCNEGKIEHTVMEVIDTPFAGSFATPCIEEGSSIRVSDVTILDTAEGDGDKACSPVDSSDDDSSTLKELQTTVKHISFSRSRSESSSPELIHNSAVKLSKDQSSHSKHLQAITSGTNVSSHSNIEPYCSENRSFSNYKDSINETFNRRSNDSTYISLVSPSKRSDKEKSQSAVFLSSKSRTVSRNSPTVMSFENTPRLLKRKVKEKKLSDSNKEFKERVQCAREKRKSKKSFDDDKAWISEGNESVNQSSLFHSTSTPMNVYQHFVQDSQKQILAKSNESKEAGDQGDSINSPHFVSYDFETDMYNSFLYNVLNQDNMTVDNKTVNTSTSFCSITTSKSSAVVAINSTISNPVRVTRSSIARNTLRNKINSDSLVRPSYTSPAVSPAVIENTSITNISTRECSVLLEDLKNSPNMSLTNLSLQKKTHGKKRVSFAQVSTHEIKQKKRRCEEDEEQTNTSFGPGSSIHPDTKQPITPMPDYASMDTPDLKKAIDQFGLRRMKKKQMVKKMQEVYKFQHKFKKWESNSSEAPSMKDSKKSKKKIHAEDRIKIKKEDVFSSLHEVIQNNKKLQDSIIHHEMVEINLFEETVKEAKIKASKKEIREFLDLFNITTYDTSDRASGRRKNKRKKK